jgi:LmbE family N-acetylglucosaminyl deacetylase
VDVSETVAAKWAAFQCHRTQFGENNFFRSLPVEEMNQVFGKEYFALARPLPPPSQQFTTLFDGL